MLHLTIRKYSAVKMRKASYLILLSLYVTIGKHSPQRAMLFISGLNRLVKQLELISQYQGRALLLISEQNPECAIGSAFCLITEQNQVRFSVNLDALTRSGVRVNPDVLMLARNKKHE